MRIVLVVIFCSVLSASICKSVTPDLYDAAVAYEQNVKTFVSVLPAITEASSRPDAAKAEEALETIKSMVAKCNNTIDHSDPDFADVKKVLGTVIANSLILQKSGPFTEPGLTLSKESAITASNKLMALLVEIPVFASAAKKSGDSDEDEDEEDGEDGEDGEDEEDGEDGENEKNKKAP